ncbi:MAG TPA: DUF962 domain-containing protein [Polyangium sp.]|nr:DUF962 domain-containing protein [Polyangium sp.]
MSTKDIESFEEFWPFYVREHSLKATRTFHFAGTTAAGLTALAAIALRRPALVPIALVAGYGPAWFSHFFIEKNKPASFKYPLWSFAADWVMWSKMLTGKMDAEVERVMSSNGKGHDENEATAGYTHYQAGTNGVN